MTLRVRVNQAVFYGKKEKQKLRSGNFLCQALQQRVEKGVRPQDARL